MNNLNEKLEHALNAFLEAQAEEVVAEAKKEDKMDAIGKEDDDIDNDGDSDSSDEYLKKKRAAIAKTMNKDKLKELAKASKEKVNEEDWSKMGDRSKDYTRRQYQKAVAAGDDERAKDFLDTYGRGVAQKVGHGQDAQGKEIGNYGADAFKKRLDKIKKDKQKS
tara:strand:+ start:1601 stop:2092 length:492 start_codon:yes stop_codon:yes gene_type:complete